MSEIIFTTFASKARTMNESNEVQEGFLCPLCMKDLGTQRQLQTHFIDEHSTEDPTKPQNFFDKARRKIMGKGEDGIEHGSYGRKDDLHMQTAAKELDFSYWEPQEIGRKILTLRPPMGKFLICRIGCCIKG